MVNISTLLIITACASVFSFSLPMKWRWIPVLSILLLSLIPVAGSNLWFWLSGAVGELSIVTVILLTSFILRRLTAWSLLETGTRQHLYYLLLAAGVLLYPATLGLSMFDPYTLGFGFELSLGLLILSIFYWILNVRQVAVVLLLVVAAEAAGVLISGNTWDYLIDPLLWLFTPSLLISMEVGRRRKVSEKAVAEAASVHE
jgi:hypothetical protein